MQLTDLNWPAIEALDRNTPVIFSVAALEQHGRHLPLFTDSLLLDEIMRRTAERVGDRVLLAPLMWLGNSHHHLDFPGTLSAPPRTYLDLLGGLMDNFIQHGFRRLVFVNGHGGNDVPGKQATFECRQRYRQRNDLLLLFATYWSLGCQPHLARNDFRQQQMSHACEWETSMMLRLAPHLVINFKGIQPTSSSHFFQPATRAWITKERTDAGHLGDPAQATADKGETLFRLFTDDVVGLLEKVIAWDGKGWNG